MVDTDTDGPMEVANLKMDGQRSEKRKVGLIVDKMKKYGMKVDVLQEGK